MIHNPVVEQSTGWLASQISCWRSQRWNKFPAWTQCFSFGQWAQNHWAKLVSSGFLCLMTRLQLQLIFSWRLCISGRESQPLIAEFNTCTCTLVLYRPAGLVMPIIHASLASQSPLQWWALDKVQGLGLRYRPATSTAEGKSGFESSLLSTMLLPDTHITNAAEVRLGRCSASLQKRVSSSGFAEVFLSRTEEPVAAGPVAWLTWLGSTFLCVLHKVNAEICLTAGDEQVTHVTSRGQHLTRSNVFI